MSDETKKAPETTGAGAGPADDKHGKAEDQAGIDAKRDKRAEQKQKAQAEAHAKAEAKGEAKPRKDKGDKGEKKAKAEAEPIKRTGPPRLKSKYDQEVVPELMKQFGYRNKMQVPKVQKIIVNMGLGESLTNPKIVDTSVEELATITGQKPVVTRARKSIANFKLRQGQKIGAMVTLRRATMWEFLDRLVSLALPRVRDFKGVSPKSFDGRGNYTLGLREQTIFPEINYDKVEKVKGMNISIVTTARTDEEARVLLGRLGMPFRS